MWQPLLSFFIFYADLIIFYSGHNRGRPLSTSACEYNPWSARDIHLVLSAYEGPVYTHERSEWITMPNACEAYK